MEDVVYEPHFDFNTNKVWFFILYTEKCCPSFILSISCFFHSLKVSFLFHLQGHWISLIFYLDWKQWANKWTKTICCDVLTISLVHWVASWLKGLKRDFCKSTSVADQEKWVDIFFFLLYVSMCFFALHLTTHTHTLKMFYYSTHISQKLCEAGNYISHQQCDLSGVDSVHVLQGLNLSRGCCFSLSLLQLGRMGNNDLAGLCIGIGSWWEEKHLYQKTTALVVSNLPLNVLRKDYFPAVCKWWGLSSHHR